MKALCVFCERAALCTTLLLGLAVSPGAAQSSGPAPSGAAAAAAPPAQANAPHTPQKVRIGIFILSIGKFDISTGAYTVDFYMTLQSDDPIGDAELEFSNGRATFELMEKRNGDRERHYRVLANLNTNIDLRKYPLDDQVLPIVLEHKTRPVQDFVLEVNDAQTAVDPDVKFVGWDLGKTTTAVVDHHYAVYNETYSQYHMDVHIKRIRLPATLKTFLPILCFLVIVFLSMMVTLEKIDNRLSMGIGVLIASVMFHVSLSNAIPPVGYLTLVDKAMMATYAVVGSNLTLTVMLMRLMQHNEKDRANALGTRGFRVMSVLTAVVFLLAGFA